MLTLNSKVKRHPKVITKKVNGQVFLLDPDTATVHILNETAGFIWEQMEKEVTIKEIVASLKSEFAVENKQAEKDVLEYLNHYYQKQLVL